MVTACPLTYKDAIKSPEKHKWAQPRQEAYEALMNNDIWKLVPQPTFPKRVLRSRWVYFQKLRHDGEVRRYKARFVAKEFSQVHRVDYEKSYLPFF